MGNQLVEKEGRRSRWKEINIYDIEKERRHIILIIIIYFNEILLCGLVKKLLLKIKIYILKYTKFINLEFSFTCHIDLSNLIDIPHEEITGRKNKRHSWWKKNMPKKKAVSIIFIIEFFLRKYYLELIKKLNFL